MSERVNAVLFPALALAYEASLLIGGRPHAFAARHRGGSGA